MYLVCVVTIRQGKLLLVLKIYSFKFGTCKILLEIEKVTKISKPMSFVLPFIFNSFVIFFIHTCRAGILYMIVNIHILYM